MSGHGEIEGVYLDNSVFNTCEVFLKVGKLGLAFVPHSLIQEIYSLWKYLFYVLASDGCSVYNSALFILSFSTEIIKLSYCHIPQWETLEVTFTKDFSRTKLSTNEANISEKRSLVTKRVLPSLRNRKGRKGGRKRNRGGQRERQEREKK